RFVAFNPLLAYVAGGIICALGVGWLLANNPTNKRVGIFIIVIGLLQGFSRFPIPHIALLAGTALSIATMWLLVTGVRNLLSYLFTRSKRYQ
ncbi:MAG: hypothetical protein FWD94_03705, partial [Treponema sp.]|nr:hypothetical protein [Treponema sp.]